MKEPRHTYTGESISSCLQAPRGNARWNLRSALQLQTGLRSSIVQKKLSHTSCLHLTQLHSIGRGHKRVDLLSFGKNRAETNGKLGTNRVT
jgi:hypothetical protein